MGKYNIDLESIFLLIWIISIVFEIWRDRRYLKRSKENEIRLKNKNDNYLYLFYFLIGFIICASSIILVFTRGNEKLDSVLLFIIGFLYMIQGLNFIPNAFIKSENGLLKFENGKLKRNVHTDKILDYKIGENQLIFKIDNEDDFFFTSLELNQTEMKDINVFLVKHIRQKIV